MYCPARRFRARAIPSHGAVVVTHIFRLGAACGCACLMAACGGGGRASTSPTPPVAGGISNLIQGQAPLQVSFDASRSSDPQGLALNYVLAFRDRSSPTGANASHTV